MTEPASVSVIIPCYRCSATIRRAVQSVIEQTITPKEILLIDDCSSDGGETVNSLSELQRNFPNSNIKIFSLAKNGGPAVARNAGWEAATQPYIAFLDADDAWHPRKIEIQYNWMKVHPDVFLSGHLIKTLSVIPNTSPNTEPVSFRKFYHWEWLLLCRFSTISVMLRRDIPFRFNPSKRYAEDYLLWLRIVLNDYDTWRIEIPLAFCFKPLYGAGGLSGNLWMSEKGELNTYHQIYREGLVPFIFYLALSFISLLKYIKRLIVVFFRTIYGMGPRN